MSSISASLPAIGDMQSLRACIPSTAGAIPEIKGWNGSNTIVQTLNENAAFEDNSVTCISTEELSYSRTVRETTTRTVENEPRISKTRAAIHPKESDSRLAQLGIVIALLGVISVVV